MRRLRAALDWLCGRTRLRGQVEALRAALLDTLAQRDDAREQLQVARTLLRRRQAWGPTQPPQPMLADADDAALGG